MHSRKWFGVKLGSVSARETAGLAICSTGLMVNAFGLLSSNITNYVVSGYCIVDGFFYLLDSAVNLEQSMSYPVDDKYRSGVLSSLGLGQMLLSAVGISIGASQNMTAICSWFVICTCLEIAASFGVLYNDRSRRWFPAETPLKNLCLAAGWLFLACDGLTSVRGCIFLAVASLISIKETYNLVSKAGMYKAAYDPMLPLPVSLPATPRA